jgi:hypothetical protein
MDKKSWKVCKIRESIGIIVPPTEGEIWNLLLELPKESARELAEALLDHVGGSSAAKDDEACGCGPAAPQSHAQMTLSQMLYGMYDRGTDPALAYPLKEAAKRAEELEKKAKHGEYWRNQTARLNNECAELRAVFLSATRQRDALAALCEDVLSEHCRCEGCYRGWNRRLAEITKKEGKA